MGAIAEACTVEALMSCSGSEGSTASRESSVARESSGEQGVAGRPSTSTVSTPS
jgi:hypothetical protein